MVRSFKFNIPDVVVAVLMLLLMTMANNEVAVNADIIAAPVGAGGHESSDRMLVVADDNHRGLHDIKYHCENDPDFLYMGEPDKDCSWVPSRDDNCRKSQVVDGTQTGKQVKFYCPLRCKSKCECVNDPDFLYKGVPGQDCDSWVLEGGSDSNCRKVQEDSDGNQTGKEVKFYCPQQCKSKCAPKRGKCENDPDFLYKGVPGQDCESWALLKPDSCRKDQKDADGKQTGKQVKFYCPQQCKSKCAPKRGECENDPDFLYKGVPGQDCDTWALLKPDSCRKDQKDADGKQTGKQVKFYCPLQCKSKCM